MYIPESLSPLPVIPNQQDTPDQGTGGEDDFVSEEKIREILVGPMLVTPAPTVSEHEPFAGRSDLRLERACPVAALSADEAYDEEPVVVLTPGEPHPALAEPRYRQAPAPRIETGRGHRSRRGNERWWVLGMGATMLALLAAGTLVEFLSSRQADTPLASPAAESRQHPAPERKTTGDSALAASNPEYPAP